MAQSFEEFLKEENDRGGISNAAVSATPNSFNEFLAREESGQPAVSIPQKPFLEREGLIQSITRPAINLGKDIFQFTSQFAEDKKRIEETQKFAADALKRTDLPDRTKQIIANIADGVDPLLDIYQPRTPEQMIGDIAGTVLLVATPASLLRGIGTGVAAQAVRGAVTGGAIGAAGGLSEGKSPKGVLKETATGGVLGAGLGAGGTLAVKGAQTIIEKAKPLLEKIMELTPIKGLSSLAARLERFGENGQEIVSRFLNADRNKLIRTGKFVDEAEQVGLFNLTREQRWAGQGSLLNRLEGRAANESDDIGRSFEVADKMRKEVAIEAQQRGVEVRFRRGVKVPFQPRENFFPHFGVGVEDIRGNTQIFQDAIENSVRIGRFNSAEEAKKVAEAYADFAATNGRGGEFWVKWLVKDGQTAAKLTEQDIRVLDAMDKEFKVPSGLQFSKESVQKIREALDEARGMTLRFFQKSRLPKFGSLERAREFDFPFYDPDPARVLPKYTLGATGRLEEIAEFGVRGQELNKLIGRIRRIQGPDAGREVAELVKNITGAVNRFSPGADKASAFMRALSVPKLAFSQIINIGQSITNTTLASDLPTVARGIRAAFTKAGIQNALRAGSTLETVINEITHRTGESAFATKFLRYTGFSATEKFDRIASSNIGIFWAQKNFNRLLAKPVDKIARLRLSELGINVNEALARGTLGENELLKAAQIFTEKTQFRARPLDLPAFANSPTGKVFFQFKNFSFNQTKFLKNEFKRELQTGNYGRAARNILILSTLFPITGEILRDIQSLATGSKRPTNALDRYLSDVSSAGGLGLASDVIESASIGRLSSTILGPTISGGIEIGETLIQAIKKGKLSDSQKRKLINQLGITRPIGNYVFQTDRKDTETFFETLRELFNE